MNVRAGMRLFPPAEDACRTFDEALNRPCQDVAGLRELLAAPTVLDEGLSSGGGSSGRA